MTRGKDRGLRSTIARLRTAYRAGDIRTQVSIWDGHEVGPTPRALLRLLETVYPFRQLLALAEELDERIACCGLRDASRWLLDTHAPGWETRMPHSTAAALAGHSALLYGNHPSLLTLFLVAACLPRDDLMVLSAAFVQQLLPSYRPYALRVHIPLERTLEQYRRGGFRRALSARALAALGEVVPESVRKAENHSTLQAAAAHVRRGGALLVAPDGGGRGCRPWHRGLGIILDELRADPGRHNPVLVPFREEHSLDFLLTRIVRRAASGQERIPIRMCFAEPTPLNDLRSIGDAQMLVRSLCSAYRQYWQAPPATSRRRTRTAEEGVIHPE